MKRRSASAPQPQHARFMMLVHYRASLAPQTERAGAGERERCGVSVPLPPHVYPTSTSRDVSSTRITVRMRNIRPRIMSAYRLSTYNWVEVGLMWKWA